MSCAPICTQIQKTGYRQMADKKLECLTWHCTDADKRIFLGLADMRGISASELMGHLIDSFMEEEKRKARLLAEIFNSNGTSGTVSSKENE